MKAGRPSASKKNLTIDDIDDGMVGLHVRVPRELRYTLKESALKMRISSQEMIIAILEREFGKGKRG